MSTSVKLDPTLIQELIRISRNVMKNAYCPYSKFEVGCALLCEDGSIVAGCNIENAAFFAICAERCAFASAIAQGHKKFLAVAISSNMVDQLIAPCGPCRQFMSEFHHDLPIILTRSDMTYKIVSLADLLPYSFGYENLVLGQSKDDAK